MPRALSDELCTMKIYDNISGSDLVLYYSLPTTKDRQDYANMAVQRHRNKVLFRTTEARQIFGVKILKGFRDGDFTIKKDGKTVPIASDPASPNYVPDWVEHIKKGAMDIIETLAAAVFDNPAEAETETGDEEEDDITKN